MINLTDEIADMIIQEEGYVGKDRNTLRSAHRRTATDYGAYYDARNYLTTGYGSLISKAPKGSAQEAKDIERWTKTFGADPFNLTAEQSRDVLTKDYNRVMQTAIKQLGDVNFEELPPAVQKSVASLTYNTGQLGKRTAALIKSAMENKSRSAWNAVADEFENWHGAKAKDQPRGVINRRKAEANWIRGVEVVNEDAEQFSAPLELPESNEEEPANVRGILSPDNPNQYSNDIPTGKLEENFRSPASVPQSRQDITVDMSNTPYSADRGAEDLEAKRLADIQADKPILERVGDFGNHIHNSFMTENVFTDISDKVISRVLGNAPDVKFDPTFRPNKIENFGELTQGIPPENLQDILRGSPNREVFFERISKYRLEETRREEMAEYFQNNPIKGFVGIGMASAMDITSYIPVANMSKFVGLVKATKNLSAATKTIGAAIGANVVEELAQEAYLISNSELRSFEDGDLLLGLVGSTVLSGAAGAMRAKGGLTRFETKVQKYNAEKNLAGLETMLRVAQRRNLPEATINELKQVIKKTENDFLKIHRATVLQEVFEQQKKIGQGILETNRISMLRRQSEFNNSVDKQIQAIKSQPDPIQKVIRDTREGARATRQEMQENLNTLRKDLTDTKKILRREEAKNLQGVERQRFLQDLRKQVEKKGKDISDLQKQMKKAAKEVSRAKAKAVKQAKKQVDPRQAEIARLEATKKEFTAKLKSVYATKADQVKKGIHPEQLELLTAPKLEEVSQYLELPVTFKSLDDIDEFMGIEFEDSIHKSAGAAQVKFKGFAKGGSTDAFFNKTDPELWNVMAREAQEARLNPASGLSVHQVKKDSTYAKMLRATHLHNFLTTDSVVGRFVLNKSALRTSDNEFAAGFYNWLSPDAVGRAGQGKLSAIEKQQQLAAIFGGTFRRDMLKGMQELNDLALVNSSLKKDLGLPENNVAARVMMAEVYHPEKVSKLVRDELLEAGTSRAKYGDEVGDVLEKMVEDFNKVQSDIATRMKNAEVVGAEGLAEGDAAKGWFHRTWDNNKAREFHHKYGDKKLTELVDSSMRKHLVENGVEINEELAKDINKQAKKFAFGLHNADLETNRGATLGMADFLEDLIAKNKEGIDTDVLKEELAALVDRKDRTKLRELGRRKPLDLNGSVTLPDGTEFYMKELLEDNVFASQVRYIETASARIAAAENGIKDIDLLDQWRKNAVDLATARGNTELAKYIDNAMKVDIRSFKYGTQAGLDDFDGGMSRLMSMAKKYQFARLMQYYGISSIGELASAIPEAGYRAFAEAIRDDLGKRIKGLFLGGITGKRLENALSDELGSITGVGLESIGFDALVSSGDRLTRTTTGRAFERFVDNAAKATTRATGHIETMGRQLAINALGLSMGNVALGRSRLDSLWGGLTNRNLVEMGLAELGPNGKAVYNSKWNNIVDSIKKYATDETGALASETGKPIKKFNIDKWELETRTAFGDALTIQSNHIFVNPDSTTAKLWHNSPVGSIYNQFRTFANNAASKVAGHNVHQAIQGYNMGSMAEFSKTAQKVFWSAALGKLSLALYGTIHEAGRPDFEERIEKYISMDDPRDWTRALGRGSVITGLDGPLDTALGAFGIDPLFDNSTIGQSRNRFDILNTPTGQLVQGAQRTGEKALSGDISGAGKELIKMSPLRRAIGVNQLLNSLGMD